MLPFFYRSVMVAAAFSIAAISFSRASLIMGLLSALILRIRRATACSSAWSSIVFGSSIRIGMVPVLFWRLRL